MAVPTFAELKVLIIDDAPIVIASLRSMLLKLGFAEPNIVWSKSPRAAVFMAGRQRFDIFICDYNFGKGLNGKQVFEELKHYKLIKQDAVFVLVTGENSAYVVHSILELKPDEYILKPFNIMTLQERLTNAISRKHALKALYQAERDGDAELGLSLCDELEPFYSDYYFVIQKFRGEFLTQLRRFDHAREVYLETLEHKDFDWAKIGLANALKQTGRQVEATQVIQDLLVNAPNHVRARVEAASISLSNNSVPEAIHHLQIANQIVPGHIDREWVLANLCLSVGDTVSALERYRLYSEINKETHRNNQQMHLNFIRTLLYAARYAESTSREKWLQEAKTILKELYDKGQHEEILPQLELVAAHFAMEDDEFAVSVEILNKIYRSKPFELFEDRYHFTWLLNVMGFDSEFAKCISWCNEALLNQESGILLESKIVLGKALKQANEDKLQWLEERYHALCNKKLTIDSLLEIYIEILERCPTLRTVCMKVVTILSRYWPRILSEAEADLLLKKCNHTILQLMNDEELTSSKYEDLYKKALMFRAHYYEENELSEEI
ncbi:response regulator [Vibrio cholerae]|uniref:response regulator n=1 Tax=Vibrio cholerae TaxID=666 RepID=UPI0010FE5657|nr:response regulator [Vibrio cholerae]EKF9825903.1 response regulator [Vibrio cholerae]ELJ8467005.1 response regulator [Vibrio cholerae]QKU78446.1 response regulator [Vibrio cholerae]TLE27000.1 response regulator [Vibrio cholerae]TLE33309.1 response regulator [Vibrio cholerae]